MAGTKGIVSAQYYTFSAANRTITFTQDYAGLDLGEITYITNIKNGVATVIYDPFDATKGGTLSGLTLTLAYDTTTMADTDPLQVIVGFTPQNADPTPVKIVPQSNDTDQTQLLQSIADDLDLISLAMDDVENTPLNVRETSIKKDIQGAIIVSDSVDASTPQKYLRTLNDVYTVDTIGYNTAIFTIVPIGTLSTYWITAETSQDRVTWSAIPCFLASNNSVFSLAGAGQSTVINSNNGTHNVIVYSVCRYTRIRASNGTGTTSISAVLRNTLSGAPSPYSNSSVNISAVNNSVLASANLPTNIAQYGGTTVPQAQLVDSAGNLASAGVFSVGSAWGATTNRPNAASSLGTGVPYPVSIGGREQPYIGALSGIFRHLTLDGGGKIVIGGDDPSTATPFQSKLASGAVPGLSPRGIGGIPNNMIGAQNLTVTDTQQAEGDTHTMLLKQILQELKILNQQFIELPFLLNAGESTMSDPQEYRNDNSNLF